MEILCFSLGVAVTMAIWRLSVPTQPIDRIRLALRKIVAQDPPHDLGISRVYSVIREVVQKEFNESNVTILDGCLREYFERTQSQGIYEEDRAIFAENYHLRSTLAPVLDHADEPVTAPPIRLSVRMCREMKELLNAIR